MSLYEHVFLARQDISGQQVEALVQEYQKIITDAGGSIAKSEYWGLKGLTYKIKKNRKAHFSLFNIDAPHEAVTEMERQMRLSSDVIRFLTIRVEEHETEPSAPMRRSDRDDRRGGRDRDDHRRGPRRDRDDRPPREHRDRGDRDDRPRRAEASSAASDKDSE